MEALKKSWWIFGVLGITAAFFNPYIGLFAGMEAIMLYINGIFIAIGRVRCRNKDLDGYQVIAKAQSPAVWPLMLFNVVFLVIIIKMIIEFTTSPKRKNMGVIPLDAYNLTVWVPAMLILSIVFEVLSTALMAFRLYDLYYNKSYTMKPRKIQFGFLKQPNTDSWYFSLWSGTGKIWLIFAVFSFTAGCFSYQYPVLTCIRFFFFFPYVISLINIKSSQSMIRRLTGKVDESSTSCVARAQHQLKMLKGKGVFITNIFAMIFIECMLILTYFFIGTTLIKISISIICDVLFIISISYKIWELAEKK